MTDYEFNVILDGAYPRVPYAGKRKSNFIDLPNDHYDRTYGQRALEDQLETLVALEGLGFDGVVVSEQHNGPIGLIGNVMVAAAWLAARTERIRVIAHGPIINDYLTPLRLAEEIAMVDTVSRGRLTFGLPMGHGMQYHSVGAMNPSKARARYREAHDLLIAAMTRPGPFEWNGDFFQIPYVNLWPKPLQEPHPPIFVAGGGSVETLQFVAEHRYTYQAVLNPPHVLRKNIARFRELCQEAGYESDPNQIALVVGIHVGETDEQARLEAEAHEVWQFQNFFRSPMHDNFPPGYVSPQSLRGILAGGYRSTPMNEMGFDDLVEAGWLIVGSPETVARGIEEKAEETGSGRFIFGVNAGSKPRWLTMKSLTLFAEEVIPRLRPGGTPPAMTAATPAYKTNSEFGARRPATAPPPTATLGDGLLDVTKAHVEDLREPVEPWPGG
ncbi:MAG: LLM class flavin-dependent oxidoreductase [Actinobacteria bacterium]|nr:LLM class flavin-dependent oxidoreductase [Actinomycetota bacterium]